MTVTTFVDTNVWVYALTTLDEKRQQQASELIGGLSRPTINGQVLRELGRVLLQKGGFTEPAFRQTLAVLFQSCDLLADSEATLTRASQLREKHRFSYWDSLIVAAAIEAGCDRLYSEDMQHGQLIDGRLLLTNPFLDPKA